MFRRGIQFLRFVRFFDFPDPVITGRGDKETRIKRPILKKQVVKTRGAQLPTRLTSFGQVSMKSALVVLTRVIRGKRTHL